MNLSNFYPLISAVFVFFLGLAVFLKSPKNRLNFTFALHALVISLWLFGTFMMFVNMNDVNSAIFWDRFIYGAVVFIPAFMYHFCLALIGKKADFWLVLAYVLSLFFLVISRTDYFVSDVFYYKWGVHTKAQLFHHFFLLYFSFYVVFWFFKVYFYYRKVESSILKYQIKYFFTAFLILFSIGPTAYLPAYGISIYPFSYLSGLLFSGIIAYAILRYRLMDMRILARWLMIYGFDAIFAYVFYILVVALVPWLFPQDSETSYVILAGFVLSPLFIFLLFSGHKLFSQLLDRFFFYSLYDFQKTISSVTAQLNTYNDLNKIIDLIVDTIKQTMGLNRAGVLLADKPGKDAHYKIAKVIGFDVNNGISLVRDSFLTQYLRTTGKPIIREELPLLAKEATVDQSASLLDLERAMKHIEASLCLPLIRGGQLLGIIVLGAKESGDPYTDNDLDLLYTLSLQASGAIENAKMYSEVKNFNKLLRRQVDEQTKELKKRADHLEKLLRIREEFLDIASHQLKTPISVIRGTLSMFRDGSMDKLPEDEKKKFMDNIYHKTEKLNIIVADILRASELDSEDFKIDPKVAQQANLEDILKEVVDDLKELADKKQLSLKLNLPAVKTNPVYTNTDLLEQAFYNLVDNAIKYTQQGEVVVSLSEKSRKLIIEIKDTGIGIPLVDQKKLFDKFSRGKNAVNMYADGSGLGLFIVKKIIEAHQFGKISVFSREGEGTRFVIELSAINKPKLEKNK